MGSCDQRCIIIRLFGTKACGTAGVAAVGVCTQVMAAKGYS